MLLFLVAIVFLAVAVYVGAEVVTYPSRQHQQAVARASRYGRSRRERNPVERLHFRERVLRPAIARLAAIALRISPKVSIESIGTRLLVAGLSGRITATHYLALKAALAVGGLVTAIVFGAAISPVAGVVFAPLLMFVGFMLPDSLVTMKMRSRREQVRAQLPDALDVLAVSVEAGLGFDGAVTKLTEHMNGALIEEFALTLGEIRIGEARHEALRKMTDRIPVPEVAAFVRAVIQADQLGISLGRILRVQAADSRLRRQAAAEEKAMKAPIKMLFPTVLFIFPAMFLVILSPALMNLEHYLKA